MHACVVAVAPPSPPSPRGAVAAGEEMAEEGELERFDGVGVGCCNGGRANVAAPGGSGVCAPSAGGCGLSGIGFAAPAHVDGVAGGAAFVPLACERWAWSGCVDAASGGHSNALSAASSSCASAAGCATST